MNLTLVRHDATGVGTFGVLLLDGVRRWFTAENETRNNYVAGETAFAPGAYQIGVQQSGGFHSSYSNRFAFHRGMLEVLGIPGNHQPLVIQIGTWPADTKGGIIIAKGAMLDVNGRACLTGSYDGYVECYQAVIDAAEAGTLVLYVVDNTLGGG